VIPTTAPGPPTARGPVAGQAVSGMPDAAIGGDSSGGVFVSLQASCEMHEWPYSDLYLRDGRLNDGSTVVRNRFPSRYVNPTSIARAAAVWFVTPEKLDCYRVKYTYYSKRVIRFAPFSPTRETDNSLKADKFLCFLAAGSFLPSPGAVNGYCNYAIPNPAISDCASLPYSRSNMKTTSGRKNTPAQFSTSLDACLNALVPLACHPYGL